jgi:hypothetical protein
MVKRGQRATLHRSGRSAAKPRRRGLGSQPTIFLAGAILSSLAVLGGFLLSTLADRDWHQVASINGVAINRAQLRARIALDAFLVRVRVESIRAAAQAGRLNKEDAATLNQGLALDADPADHALDELIDEEVLRQGAITLRVAMPTADAGAELVAATIVDARLHVRSVTLAAPAPPKSTPPDRDVAGALKAGELPSTIAATATADGWTASGSDAWLSTDGPPVPKTAPVVGRDVSPSLLLAARTAPAGTILGPFTDEVTRDVLTGLLVETASDGPSPASIRQQAADSGVDTTTLDAWAKSHALRRAVAEHLVSTWATTPVDQVRAAELVLGAPPDGGNPGPFVELAHLVVRQLAEAPASASPPPTAAALASELRALPLADRLVRFAALVSVANTSPSATALARSGEVGIVPRSGLMASLGEPAFAPGAKSGDILGPVSTSEGDELFLLKARYAGALDEATIAALIVAREPGADLAAMAERIDPGLVPRARSGPWRGRPEFAAGDPATTVFDAPVGVEADPIVIDRRLIVARVLEHRTTPAAGVLLDRLRLNGFGPWLADQRAAAVIVRDANPLGSGGPSTSPSGSGLRSVPADTPFLPSLPGLGVPSPTPNPLSFPVAP